MTDELIPPDEVEKESEVSETTSNLEAEAQRRKERLLAMKRKLIGSPDTEDHGELANEADIIARKTLRNPVFRNYQPESSDLKSDSNPIDPIQSFAVEEELGEHLASTNAISDTDNVDLTTLAPRKIDWDLKRDISKKLEKLERRTQRAIADLIRKKLASGKQDLLLSAIDSNVQLEANQADHDSDMD